MKLKNKKSRNIIGIIQSCLIFALVILVIFMMIQINRLQGTARVINYAGLVRGATQREVKLEITGSQNDELIKYLDDILGQFTRNYTQTTKRGLLTTNKG